MENLIDQLHDIDGLLAVSAWPPAIGYYFLMAFVALIAVLLFRWYRYNRSWKKDTLLKLSELEKTLSEENARESLIDLSNYLRRIALMRFSRKECAGLVGKEWLKWLQTRDKTKFNWEEKGKLLVDAPYCPEGALVPVPLVKELILATKKWVQ